MEEAATPSSPSPRSRSTEPWLWVIDYLSIFPQIPTSLLHDVIEAAPQMPDEDGKTTMEMVALRCLEDLFTHDDDDPATHCPPCGTPATPPPFDPSLTCEAALQAILQSKKLEELHGGGTGILGWDIRPFTRRKRATMPKCTLQLLRDGTLGVGCRPPWTTSLAEAIGVSRDDGRGDTEPVHSDDRNLSQSRSEERGSNASHAVETEGNVVHDTLENDGAARDDLSDGNLLLSKRRRSSLVDEEAVDSGGQNLSLLRSDDEEHGSPRTPVTEGKNVIWSSRYGNGIEPNNLDRGNMLLAKRDMSPSVDREQDIADSIDDCRSKAKRLKPDLSRTNPSVQQVSQVSLPLHTEQFVDEVSGRMAVDAGDKLEDLLDAVDELEDLNDCSLKPTSSKGFCQNTSIAEEEGSLEHNYAEYTSCNTDEYHHLRVDVSMVKNRFLSSRCTLSDDYLATVDCKEHNLCTKCNLDGQLLICSAVGCPLVVHKRCLGSSPKYKSGNFYCPFCAYSLAISELEEAIKKASLARKKLTAFIHTEPSSKGCSERLNGKEDGNSRRNQKEGPLQNIDKNGHLENGRAIKGTACAVDDHHSIKRKDNPQQLVPPGSCSDANVLGGGGPIPTATPSDNSVRKKGRERRRIPEEEPVEELVRQEDRIRENPKSRDNASSEDHRVAFLKNIMPDNEAFSRFSEKEAAKLLGNLASAADDVSDNPNHSRRSRSSGKKCTYTYPAAPQLKRQRVPWTAEEEEMLKEGVQKFSNASENMPWRVILEYGSSVFWKGRTPVDLKDKWRNICKART